MSQRFLCNYVYNCSKLFNLLANNCYISYNLSVYRKYRRILNSKRFYDSATRTIKVSCAIKVEGDGVEEKL